MKLTILGSGTSQGVPVIGCRCEVCTSTDSRDKRLRTSAMIETDGGARFVIDAGPDFRCQMLRAGVSRLDAILLTHEHKDHTGGIDDVRAFNFVDYPPVIHPVDIYAAPAAARVVRKDYDYAFEEEKYRGAPDIRLHEIDVARPLEIAGERIVPVSGHHSERFEVTGYRIGRMAYLTDFKTIADAEVGKLIGVELLVVNDRIPRISMSRRRWHSSPGSRLAGRLSRMCRTRSGGTRRRRLFCRGGSNWLTTDWKS